MSGRNTREAALHGYSVSRFRHEHGLENEEARGPLTCPPRLTRPHSRLLDPLSRSSSGDANMVRASLPNGAYEKYDICESVMLGKLKWLIYGWKIATGYASTIYLKLYNFSK